jgi:hypothetical protein
MTLCGVSASAHEPGDAGESASSVAVSELRGRVFERGSITPLGGAHIVAASGDSCNSDDEGYFSMRLPAGPMALVVTLDGYQPLHVTETLRPHEGLVVDYRLLLDPDHKRRYVSTVRGEGRHEGERFSLQDEELHQTAGTLGDPFRTIGLMPGVVQPLTLLPVYVIRGASPGTNGFFLDGMRVPQLFHFVVGGGVVHASLVDRLDFYPGVYDVSFGHYAGGIIDSETRPGRADAPAHGEVELRLYDVSALVEVKLPDNVRVEVAGHYGYPAFLVHAFDNKVNVNYWDFQLRVDWRTITVEVLGSYDFLSIVTDDGSPATAKSPAVPPTISNEQLQFYRLQIRDRRRIGRVETEEAIVLGYDEFEAFGPAVVKLSLDWRANVRARWSRFRLALGIDGEISRFHASNFDTADNQLNAPDTLGDLAGTRDGVESGAYVEGTVEIFRRRLWATVGVRADVYHASGVTLLGVDPRFSFRAQLLPQLSIKGGIGLYQQPPSFPIALPGVDTFALQLGLQRAIQADYGFEAKLPWQTTLSITAFWEQFYNVNDAVLDFSAVVVCSSPPPESLTGYIARITRQINGQSYGMEVLARKHAGRFTGWLSYTLSRSERRYSCGLRPSDFDQTHVLNAVAQMRLPWNLMVGARILMQTGRPVTVLQAPDYLATVRNNVRLPTFFQLDLRIDREWLFKKWALDLFVEVVNLTYSDSIISLTYPTDPTTGATLYNMPKLNGFKWVLPSIGLRGRF